MIQNYSGFIYLEDKIYQFVYELYGLSKEEIQIVEGNTNE